MITQSDLVKAHNHKNTPDGNPLINTVYAGVTGWPAVSSGATSNGAVMVKAESESSGGIESRPKNTSIRIWKRTA